MARMAVRMAEWRAWEVAYLLDDATVDEQPEEARERHALLLPGARLRAAGRPGQLRE